MPPFSQAVFVESEAQRVEEWRLEMLVQCGFPPDDAALLAVDPGADVHEACGLLEAGCSVGTALRILL